MAIDPEGTRVVMGELARDAIFTSWRVLASFYNLKREMVGEAYFQQVNRLEDTFRRLVGPVPLMIHRKATPKISRILPGSQAQAH